MIKFRLAYTEQNDSKSMIYWNDDGANRFLINFNGTVFENYGSNWNEPNWITIFDTIPPILQRFTGSVDIKGKDIYEGDLVSLHYSGQPKIVEAAGVYEVIYERASFYLKEHKHNWMTTSFTNPKVNTKRARGTPPFVVINKVQLSHFKICKVIGNIFENPELK